MSSPVTYDLCRLTVVVADRRADVAVPVRITVGELVPVLLRHEVAAQLSTADGAEHWVLQRFGDGPLEEGATPESAGLHDGDTVYLVRAADPIPAIDFDDVTVGVGEAVRRTEQWQPEYTRRLLLALGSAGLGVTLLSLLVAGPGAPRATIAGVVALLLAAASVAASRAFGNRRAAAILGTAATGFAGVCGLLAPALLSEQASAQAARPQWLGLGIGSLGGGELLAAGALGAAVAALVLAAAAVAAPAFVCLVVVFGALGLAGLLMSLWCTPAEAAGVLATTTLVINGYVPQISARIARLRLPHLPNGADDLADDIEPVSEGQVSRGSAVAARYMSILFLCTGLVCAGCAPVLAAEPGWAASSLLAAISVSLLLRSRVLPQVRHRLAVLLGGAVGLLALAVSAAEAAVGGWARLVVVGVLLALSGLLVHAAGVLPGLRLRPFWGWAADTGETVTAVLALPLLALVLDLLGLVRGLVG